MLLTPSAVWVSEARCQIGENPLWDRAQSALYWIDITGPAVYRMCNQKVERFECPKPVGSIYLADGHHLLVALRSGLAWLDLDSGALEKVSFSAPLKDAERFNDGRCDLAGDIWISTLDRKTQSPLGSIVHFDSGFRGTVTPSQAVIGNGICFANDDSALYFSDSRNRTIFRYAKEGPRLGNRTVVSVLDGTAGRPDGCTVDAEGCLWSARIMGGCIDRYLPDGRLIDRLQLPVADPTHCTFGGPDMKTLFVTTAHAHGDMASRDPALAGAVLAFEMDVQGVPENRLNCDFRVG